MIKLKSLISEQRTREEMIKSLQVWLDNKIEHAPGKTRSEKTDWLWKNDVQYGKVATALQKFHQFTPRKSIDAIKSERNADRYYVRFGDLPKDGKSTNWIRREQEKGISAYPVKWSNKLNMWVLSTDDLSETGLNTLGSMVSDFNDNKGRPIYLINGQELDDVGIDDGEPLLDASNIKIIKKLDPSEIWIDYYNGNDWWK